MKFFFYAFFTVAVTCCCNAENLLKYENSAPPFKGKIEVVDQAQGIFKAGRNRYDGKNFIAVDPNKSYRLSGVFRGDKNAGRILMGMMCFDGKKNSIGMHHINAIPNTAAKLVKPAVKGAKEIFITDGSSWSKITGKVAAFNVKDDFSDLPNRNCHYYIQKVEKNGDAWKITFNRPLVRNYPAGTAVRMHKDGGFMNAVPFVKPNAQWQEFSAVIGKVQSNADVNKNLWPGTEFVKVFIVIYPGSQVEFKELKLVPMP